MCHGEASHGPDLCEREFPDTRSNQLLPVLWLEAVCSGSLVAGRLFPARDGASTLDARLSTEKGSC